MSGGKGKDHQDKTGRTRDIADNAEGRRSNQNKSEKRFWTDYEPLEKLNSVLALCAVLSSLVSIGLLCVAKGAFDISKAAMQDVQRAFVFMKDVEVTGDSDKEPPESFAWVVPRFENTGETPAKNFRTTVNVCTRSDALPNDFSYPDFASEAEPSIIAPRAEGTIFLPINRAILHRVYSGALKLYVWGWFRYEDVFDLSHHVQFCEAFKGLHFKGTNTDTTDADALFDVCQRHNCEDDDCPQNGWGTNSDTANCPPQTKPPPN